MSTKQVTTPSNCPASKGFKLIQGKCYALDKFLRNFDDTQARCGQIFGSNIGGKIFEPQSHQVIQEVLEFAKNILEPDTLRIWVGITDKISEGKFVYYSNGQFHRLSWGFVSSNDSNKNCLLVHWLYIQPSNGFYKKLHHYNCSTGFNAAICEWAI